MGRLCTIFFSDWRKAFKAWKAGSTRASYDAAKPNARHAVHHARQEADKKIYENIDPKSSEVYHLANQLRRENTDVVSLPGLCPWGAYVVTQALASASVSASASALAQCLSFQMCA